MKGRKGKKKQKGIEEREYRGKELRRQGKEESEWMNRKEGKRKR